MADQQAKIKKLRKTLVQLASESTIRDPAVHAQQQVRELDKQAKNSEMKRKFFLDQLERERNEVESIDDQISRLKLR